MRADVIAIGELSRRTSCNVETVRYYERIGLPPKPSRRGRYRTYGAEDVRRLSFVRRARKLGFTLDEVRALLRLASCGQAACAEVRTLSAGHLGKFRGRLRICASWRRLWFKRSGNATRVTRLAAH